MSLPAETERVGAPVTDPRAGCVPGRRTGSDLACRTRLSAASRPCPAARFEEAFAAVARGPRRARHDRRSRTRSPAASPTSTTCCRVRASTSSAEHFQRVNHHLLAPRGRQPGRHQDGAQPRPCALRSAASILRELDLKPVDPCRHRRCGRRCGGGAATRPRPPSPRRWRRRSTASISLRADIEDAAHNTTRFLVMAPRARSTPIRRTAR